MGLIVWRAIFRLSMAAAERRRRHLGRRRVAPVPRRDARDDAVGRDHAEDVEILDHRLRQRVEDIHVLLGVPRPHHLRVGRLEGNDLVKAEVLDSRQSISAGGGEEAGRLHRQGLSRTAA